MEKSISQSPISNTELQDYTLLALRAAVVVTICLTIAYVMFQKTWLLSLVIGILIGLAVIYFTQPISHRYQEISDGSD